MLAPMNDSELAEVEQGIRALLREFDLAWVLSDIEEGIKAKGRVEVVVPRARKAEVEQGQLIEAETVAYALPSPGYKGPTMVGHVQVSPAERVEVAIEALRRVIVELPSIHEDAVSRLEDSDDRDSKADDMIFLPDEDDSAKPVPGIEMIKASAGPRRKAEEFLLRLRDEVMR